MKKKHKFATAVAAVGIGFAGVSARPADAAVFDFTLIPDGHLSSNQFSGSLSFSQSNLSGVGVETATLSDLQDAVFSLNYFNYLPLSFGPEVSFSRSSFPDPSFTLDNGNLEGINSIGSAPFMGGDGRDTFFFAIFSGTDQLSLEGSKFAEAFSGILSEFSKRDGSLIFSGPLPSLTINQGTISFTTVEPITPAQPVPEPLTYVGTAVAGGIGWLMKRKQATAQKAKA